MGRKKKIVPEDLDPELEDDGPQLPIKDHHWSDDGPRYNAMVETEHSKGYRVYSSFFESQNLSDAKNKCLEKFNKDKKPVVLLDRAEFCSEVLRYESTDSEIKNEPTSKKRKQS